MSTTNTAVCSSRLNLVVPSTVAGGVVGGQGLHRIEIWLRFRVCRLSRFGSLELPPLILYKHEQIMHGKQAKGKVQYRVERIWLTWPTLKR